MEKLPHINLPDLQQTHLYTTTQRGLASSSFIAIMPVIGWWRERTNLGRWESKTRHSLIVSIETENTEVDVYTPIAQQLNIQTTVPVSTSIQNRI